MQIVKITSNTQISIDEALSCDGIIVTVYGGIAKVLGSYSDGDIKYGFAFQSLSGGCFHSASSTKKAAIEKNMNSQAIQCFFFQTLAEFAQAALDNKWKI